MPAETDTLPALVASPQSSFDSMDDDDESRFSGYVEVKAVEDPAGMLKDEVMVVLPKRMYSDFVHPNAALFPSNSHHRKTSSTSTTSRSNAHAAAYSCDLLETIPDENDQEESKEELDPLEYSFMAELAETLDAWLGCQFDACAQQQPVLKSALRRRDSSTIPAIDRNVSFTKLEIREFNMTLGDHPSAVTGPPVMLDAQPTRESVVDLDSYEQARPRRRSRRQLKLSFEDRRGILENERGFTVEEVKKAWSEALMIRKQRMETRQRTQAQQMMDEAWESANRKFHRLFGLEDV